MKLHHFSSALIVCCMAATLSAESSNPTTPRETVHYTKAELKQLRDEAHTPEQYRTLAVYYSQRKQSFREQADSEKKEWERRSQNVVGSAAKYPRPVDSAKYLSEYYSYEADQAGALEAQYEHLAGSGSGDVATAPASPSH
jgi:hypothetical protein